MRGPHRQLLQKKAQLDPSSTQLLYHTSNLLGVHVDPAYCKSRKFGMQENLANLALGQN